ncbi:16S rRNA (guanine(966)-N(2))-methyltransferase RsmD [Parachlamydia sp. AcF125]|uniref:16S rRNA (guanine(966)-N(2))-methyltransferase RsmD n=1 Tax=Parachlamydia sp. AcF125 TaxID=2795736 RepID=UPI001BC8DBA7|nr:16S rRNA (guanine(966)-N(2))-methyltransferase RsmD [Parachlamydia sp. AcF125]MBS4167975.1 Ribosomal RNA small subunit methyltransferase D [Parachlamydia sp. AcF125]
MRIIAGLHKNRQILAPKGDKTRPTSNQLRAALFNICQLYIEDAHFLDLFAGSGAIGLEALSRGAKKVVFVDNQRESIQCIQHNLANLKEEARGQVFFNDAFDYLKESAVCHEKFDIIYADPPYDSCLIKKGEALGFSEKILQMVNEKSLLRIGGLLFLEDSRASLAEVEAYGSLRLRSARQFGHSKLLEYQNFLEG